MGILFLSFQILIYFFPSKTILKNGVVEQSMAMGQFFISVLIAIISFIILIYLGYNFFDKKIKTDLFGKDKSTNKKII